MIRIEPNVETFESVDKELMKKLNNEADKEKRSLNNLILFILAKHFEDKKHG